MGRHQVQGGMARARLSIGGTALAGLIGSATYALVVPAAAPVPESAAVVAVAHPAVAPVVITPTRATTTTKAASTTCDLSGPAVFGDPAHPNRITNRACGTVDVQGRERSRDPWIDAQLVDARR